MPPLDGKRLLSLRINPNVCRETDKNKRGKWISQNRVYPQVFPTSSGIMAFLANQTAALGGGYRASKVCTRPRTKLVQNRAGWTSFVHHSGKKKKEREKIGPLHLLWSVFIAATASSTHDKTPSFSLGYAPATHRLEVAVVRQPHQLARAPIEHHQRIVPRVVVHFHPLGGSPACIGTSENSGENGG